MKKEEYKTNKGKSLKRKASLKERGLQKKKRKYIIEESSNETSAGNFKTLSTVDIVRNVNSIELLRTANEGNIDKEHEKLKKKKKKEERRRNQTEVLVIEDSSEPQTNYIRDDKTFSRNMCTDANGKENYTLLNYENGTDLAKSKKGKKTEVMVAETKLQGQFNEDGKRFSVCSNGNEEENHVSNHENATDLIKSKVNKKTKKKKKKKKMGTVEPDKNIATVNKPVVKQNINNNKNINGNPVSTEVHRNISTLTQQSKTCRWENTSKYNKFQKKIMEKLKGGQFRWINEKLYSCKSSEAVNMFSSDPKLFDIYHNGFHSQVEQWPQNPVDVIIDYIKAR